MISRKSLTVAQMIRKLQDMPQSAEVMFLDTDDPYRAAAIVDDVETLDAFRRGLVGEGTNHRAAATTIREARLRAGCVVLAGVTL